MSLMQAGGVYIADSGANVIRHVFQNGTMVTSVAAYNSKPGGVLSDSTVVGYAGLRIPALFT
jgi:hypothetical protein